VPASQEQKVDFLLKKIGYSASKTGIAEDESTISGSTNTRKFPFEEAIPSPLVIPSSSILADSSFIPTTPPGSDTAYIKVYPTSSALRMTVDSTVGSNTRSYIAYTTYNDTSSARLTNWIDTQFGSGYIIKVFKNDATVPANELSQVGANNQTDGWFFDYSSGVLNFNGVNLPSHTDIYIVGYRYIGATGARPPAGIGTFEHLYVAGVSTFMGSIDANSNLDVAGISTFQGLIDANGLIEATAGQNKIPSLYANFSDLPNAGTYHGMFAHVHQHARGYFAHAGNWLELVNKETDGRVGTGTETYNVGFLDATNLDVTGITTLGSIGISTGRITGPAITYIDPATVGDDTGTLVVKGNLQVEGTQTTVNSSTMTVTDKNIELAKGAANDAAADGGGITVDSGGGDKTWQWLDATDSWTSSEHIRIPDGKVFGFASDTNTYIGRPAADTIAFTHGGIEKVRITSAGKVGIGLTDPETYSLAPNLVVSDLTSDCGITIIGQSSNSTHSRIAFGRSNFGTGQATAYIQKNHANTGAWQFHTQVDDTPIEFRSAGDIILRPNTGGETNYHEHFTFKNSGDVGIGSATPTAKLDVIGDTKLQGNLDVAGISTFTGNIDANGDLDVDGQTHLDDVRITGVTTSQSYIKFTSTSADAKIQATGIPNAGSYNNILAGYNDGVSQKAWHFINGSTRNADGGPNTYVIRNNDGTLHLGKSNHPSILQGDTVSLYNESDLKLQTSGIGVTVTGQLDTTNIKATGITTTGTLNIGITGHTMVGITTILDEDNMASNSATALATQQSIKAYVDTSSPSGSNLAVSADSGSNESINLNTEVLDIEGTANEIETATGTNKVVIGLPNDVSITNLTLGGSVSAGSTTGTDGYYLKTTGIGVTWAAFPSSRTGLTTTATAGQTTFNFSYNIGFVDVFVNGVKLPASEFTASNGSTIVLDDAAFANDTLEFISLNTLPVTSGGGASNLTGLADVTISGTPVIGETLQHNGSQFVNDYTVSTTTTSTSQTAILNLPVATYRSVEYTIQITEGTKYHVTKVLAIHDGTNVTFNEYGTLTTSTSLSTFALDVNSGNMRLLATPASTNSTVFKVKFTGIKV
jgi:cytoskeletal protein CcmA (bactofilin family)